MNNMKWSPRPSTRRAAARALAVVLLASALAPRSGAQSGAGARSSPGARGPASELPRLSPDPLAAAFSRANAAGGLAWETSLDLALWASGGPPEAAERERAAITAAVADLRAAVGSAGDGGAVRRRAEYVLAFMHERFLTAYSERQTRLDTLAATGRFNCVSSAALYVVLASAVGVDVEGAATKDHAFCTVSVGGELVDVETTSPYGFDPGTRTEFLDQFGKTTGFAYVSPRNYRDRSAITRLELLSLILSNRIVELEAAGRYAEAVGVALDRRTLVAAEAGAAEADRELLERMLNYGTSLARTGRERDALAWVERAKGVTGADPRWDDFAGAAANNLLAKLVTAGRIPEARAEFVRLSAALAAPTRARLDTLVTDAELLAAIGAAKDRETTASAVAAVTAAASRGVVPAGRARELSVYAYLTQAERVARADGWAAAMAAVDEAVAAVGDDRKLSDARRAYRANRIAELHNSFASLYNKRLYEEARNAARRALEEFPDEARLRSDLVAAERALAD